MACSTFYQLNYVYSIEMNRHHEDPLFKEKKKPKGEIKFNLHLNEEQKLAKELILKNTVTILNGKAGSGKSTVAAQAALDLLFRGEVEKIIVTRALVTSGKEDVGYLPGSIQEKMAPFTAPVYDNMYRLYNKEKIDKMLMDKQIEVIPLAFIRGRNFSNTIVIADEYQNMTDSQSELILTRICLGSKIVLCGDIDQCDLDKKENSCIHFITEGFKNTEDIAIVDLKTNHRHPIVDTILKVYKSRGN